MRLLQVCDEFIFEFTHTVEMDWMLPGVKPTGRHVRVPFVVFAVFEGDKASGDCLLLGGAQGREEQGTAKGRRVGVTWELMGTLSRSSLMSNAVVPTCT